MVRKKKKQFNISPTVIKVGVGSIVALGLGIGLFIGVSHFMLNAEYFKVTQITIEPSLQFISMEELAKIKGNNIFSLDIKKIQKRLSFKYPQISDLRVERHLPNQIHVGATKRYPFAQVQIGEDILTVDKNAIILSGKSKREDKITLITGLKKQSRYRLGLPLNDVTIKTAIQIIKLFQEDDILTYQRIERMDISNTSKIFIYLSSDLKIIMDKENMTKKIKQLSLVLSQGHVSSRDAKYVDLRFKEPIIGTK